MGGGKRVYHEGREAFRNSVPYLRVDSVDAPSLWEGEEGEEAITTGIRGRRSFSLRRGEE